MDTQRSSPETPTTVSYTHLDVYKRQLKVFALVPPSLPSAGGGGGGGEFIIGGVGSLQQLSELSDAILAKAYASKRFIFLDKDLKIDKPRIEVNICLLYTSRCV